jgi:hypothetical protein
MLRSFANWIVYQVEGSAMSDHLDSLARVGFLGGSSLSATGWLTSVDWIAAIGAAVLVASFFVNLTFRRREDNRKQERWNIEKQILLDTQNNKS